jgi:hypothetical protein
MTETIKPTYLAPDGTILIPQDSVESLAKEYGYKLFGRALRQFSAHLRIPKGDECPLCRQELAQELCGRLHGMPIVPGRVSDEY